MRKKSTPRSKPLSEEKLAELTDNASHILEDCRYQLIRLYPFCGSVMMSLDIVPTRDSRITTACTDGSTIYFDIDFLSTLSPDERLFVLAHEVWHGILQHMIRREGRDAFIFNLATDMEVNEMLVAEGFMMPKDCVLPAKYGIHEREQAAEKYYELLIKQANKNGKGNKSSSSQSGNSKSKSKSGNSQSNSDNDGEGEPQDDNTSGNSDGKLSGQFDQHIYDNQGLSQKEKDVDDKYGKVTTDPNVAPNVTKNKCEKLRAAAVAAAQKIEKESGRGNLPGCIQRLVGQLTESKISWKEVLAQFVLKSNGTHTDWSMPNRRFAASGTYLPSHDGTKLNVAVGIDTSGSTNAYINDFMGELNGILSACETYDLTLVECDTQVGKFEKYSDESPLDFTHYKMSGGGGTELNPIFKKLEKENEHPDCVVVFTDGYCEKFTEKMDPQIPVLWVLTDKDNDNNFEFGQIVHYEK